MTVNLTFVIEEAGILRFDVSDSEGLISEKIDLTLKYWESRTSYNVWSKPHDYFQNSGAYIFCPADGQLKAEFYTKLMNHTKIDKDTFVF